MEKEKLRQRVLLNGGAVFKDRYELEQVPTVFWIDRSGRIMDVIAGDVGAAVLERQTKKLVAMK